MSSGKAEEPALHTERLADSVQYMPLLQPPLFGEHACRQEQVLLTIQDRQHAEQLSRCKPCLALQLSPSYTMQAPAQVNEGAAMLRSQCLAVPLCGQHWAVHVQTKYGSTGCIHVCI